MMPEIEVKYKDNVIGRVVTQKKMISKNDDLIEVDRPVFSHIQGNSK